jgi:hypothetical protein
MEKMNTLLHYSPCEISLIIDHGFRSHKQLLWYCLADLVQRGILEIEEREAEKPLYYVRKGPKAIGYIPRIYEQPFLSVFEKFYNPHVSVRNYAKMVMQRIPTHSLFNRLIWKSPAIWNEFERGWFARLFGSITLSDQGQNVYSQLKSKIAALARELPELMQNDPKAAAEIVDRLGARTLLIPGLDIVQLQGLDAIVLGEFGKVKKVTDAGDSGCGGGSCGGFWGAATDLSGAFDHGGHGHDGGHGCGGDSGCSGGGGDSGCGGGCSGCGGGCGGCGGCS